MILQQLQLHNFNPSQIQIIDMHEKVKNKHIHRTQNFVSLKYITMTSICKKLEERPSHIFINLSKTNSHKGFPFLIC